VQRTPQKSQNGNRDEYFDQREYDRATRVRWTIPTYLFNSARDQRGRADPSVDRGPIRIGGSRPTVNCGLSGGINWSKKAAVPRAQ
jgi:hypothetical protein